MLTLNMHDVIIEPLFRDTMGGLGAVSLRLSCSIVEAAEISKYVHMLRRDVWVEIEVRVYTIVNRWMQMQNKVILS